MEKKMLEMLLATSIPWWSPVHLSPVAGSGQLLLNALWGGEFRLDWTPSLWCPRSPRQPHQGGQAPAP